MEAEIREKVVTIHQAGGALDQERNGNTGDLFQRKNSQDTPLVLRQGMRTGKNQVRFLGGLGAGGEEAVEGAGRFLVGLVESEMLVRLLGDTGGRARGSGVRANRFPRCPTSSSSVARADDLGKEGAISG